MNKDNEANNIFNQMAIILNYKPLIGEQHIHTGEPEAIDESKAKVHKGKGGRPKRAGKPINKAFIYDAGDETNARLQLFYDGLLVLEWIKKGTELKSFLSVFSGKETTNRITWIGDTNVLVELFQELIQRKEIVKLPKGETIWVMVNARFWDHEGNKEFGNRKLGSTHSSDGQRDNIDLLVDLLNPDTDIEEVKERLQSQ